MVANTWFPDKERATASAIMILANPFSLVVSFGIQGYYSGRGFFPADATVDDESLVKRGADWIILCQTFLTTILVIYFVLVYRDKPKYPPSKMAENVSHNIAGGSVWKETWNLMKMKNFMLLCFCFCILYGASSTIGLVMNPILLPYGYTSFFISMGAILCVVCGVIASVLVGMFLDRTKKYLLTLRIEAWFAAICFLMTIWIIPLHTDPVTLIFLVLAGVAAVPVTPLGFVFSIELTHPAQPVLVNGLLLMSGQIGALCMSVDMSFLAKSYPLWTLATYGLLCLAAAVASCFMKEELRL